METHFLQEIVTMFGLSIVVVLVCHRFRLPAIVGFLLTGALCGPSALGVVTNQEAVDTMAEIGVQLLLFTIGMELSGSELKRLKRPIFMGGTTQVLLTIGVVALISASSAGFSKGITYGCLVALSSTAIVLNLLQSKAQMESPHGRICLAILIFQDLAIVPIMLALPLLAGTGEQSSWADLMWDLGRSALVLSAIVLLARYALPRLMLSVVRTRSRELMLMTTLGLCLAVALATASVGLSLSLGAFLAGLLLAESEYSLNVLENVLPFKEVFTSIFFVSVGMLLDMDFFLTHMSLVLSGALGIMLIKILLAVPAVRLVGYSWRTAVIAGFSLAQIGEFSFVLARTAQGYGLLDVTAYQAFLASSIVTMSLTPLMIGLGPRVAALLLKAAPHHEGAPESSECGLKDHLIIIGFGVGGKNLARVAKESGIPYVILEMNPDTVARYKASEPIRHGDASFPMVLDHLGVAQARVLSIMVSDPAGIRAIIHNARKLNPGLYIVVRSRFLGEVAPLKQLGANDVVPEEFETSIEVFARVLNYYLVPRHTIEQYVSRIREENYSMVRQMELPANGLHDLFHSLPDLRVAAYAVEGNSPLAGMNLADSGLRSRYNITVAGIRRGHDTLLQLGADTVLEPGDVAYLLAGQDALLEAVALFQARPQEEIS